VDCPEHGVSNVKVPRGAKNSRFTLMMERLIIDLLLACQNVKSVCGLVGIGWDAIAQVMERTVKRGQKRKVSEPINCLGVDEKSFRKGHHYITVISDLEKGSVEHIAENRDKESLAGYYQKPSESHKQGIQVVAMDMCLAYEQATLDHLPEGEKKIVFDRFHIMQNLNKALDRVRQSENFELSRRKDQTLAKTRQMWLWGQENLPEKYQERFGILKDLDLKTSKPWALRTPQAAVGSTGCTDGTRVLRALEGLGKKDRPQADAARGKNSGKKVGADRDPLPSSDHVGGLRGSLPLEALFHRVPALTVTKL